MRALLIAALLLLPSPSFAQVDEFPFTRCVVVNSPMDMTSWPITASITGVKFELNGWRTDFDRRLGPNAWPSLITPGWDGPLQYTLGLARHTGGYWTCSAVVEFWQRRLEEEGPHSAASPNEIAKEWFYDSRWGELAGWQPAIGEEVGVFVIAGDGRNTTTAFPGTIKQRTAGRLLRWGTDIGGAPSQPQQPQQPSDQQNPGQPQQPTQPHPGEPVDMSDIRTLLKLTATYEQSERIFADLIRRDQEREKQIESLRADINKPAWFTSLLSNRYVQLAIATLGTYVTTHQMTK